MTEKKERLSGEEFAQKLERAPAWFIEIEPDARKANFILHVIQDDVEEIWYGPDVDELGAVQMTDYTFRLGRLMIDADIQSRRIE